MKIKGILRKKKSIGYATPGSSWNPYTGCLATASECAVKEENNKCWAEKMAQRLAGRFGYDKKNPFKPTFHKDKLEIPLHWKEPRRIPCCFMGDIAYANFEEIFQIFEVIRKTPQHIYYILTKKPEILARYYNYIATNYSKFFPNVFLKDIIFPENILIGTTINCQKDVKRIEHFQWLNKERTFISFEPLYENIDIKLKGINRDIKGLEWEWSIDWIIIGAQTQPSFQPKKEWVDNILKEANKHKIPVFMKENLAYTPKRYEFPFILKED